MPTRVSLFKAARLIHLYVGVFISPALLFFAFTGALQTIGLHEGGHGSHYQPPRWISELAQLHKKQTLDLPQKRIRPQGGDSEADHPPRPDRGGPPHDDKPRIGLLLMKIFFLLVCIGLLTSTISGLYLSYKFGRNPWVITAIWVAGIIVPIGFLYV